MKTKQKQEELMRIRIEINRLIEAVHRLDGSETSQTVRNKYHAAAAAMNEGVKCLRLATEETSK